MSTWELGNANLKNLVPYEPGKPIDDVARELGLDPSNIVKLASNENPLGPSPQAKLAMGALLEKTNIYPDGGGFHLRNAIADQLNVERNQVILGNGSNEIIEFAYHAFTQPAQSSVVASRYAFVVYKLMAQLFNIEFIEVADKNFHHDLDAMKKAIRPDTKLVFIANPNNPTGTRIPNNTLYEFVSSVPSTTVVVLDEAYYEFLENPPASVQWASKQKNLLVLRTFSKIQGLAGLRIGYGITHPETAEIIQRCRQPFNANALAQAAALAGIQDQEHQEKTRSLTIKGRQELEQFFQKKELPYLESEGNFVMVKVGKADGMFQALLQRGVIIRSMTSYGLPEWVRISIGTSEEMKRFEKEFDEIFSKICLSKK